MITLIIMARRRVLHPSYTQALEHKLDTPAEIYAYPAAARREAAKQWRAPKVPAAPRSSEPAPSLRWLPAAYGVVIMALWFVGANVTPGV